MEKKVVPNTFIIGAQKSGTSTVHNWLKQHPNVSAPESAKDFPFFTDRFYQKGIDYLSSYYSNKSTSNIIVNGYAHYLFESDVPERIQALDERAKLILCLRNPIERIISSYLFAKKRGIENCKTLEEALDKEKERMLVQGSLVNEFSYIANSKYGINLERFVKVFGKNQIKVILFEDLKNDPEKVYKSLCEFLGLDVDFKPSFRKINETGQAMFPFVNKLLYRQNPVKKMLSEIIPHKIRAVSRRKIMRMNTKASSTKFELSNLTRDRIIGELKEDIQLLSAILKKDLSYWIKQ